MRILGKTVAAVAACVFTLHGTAQTEGMDEFVDDLMSRMTLSEKIGQLNLQVAGDITTGQAQNTQVAGIIRAGGMGGVFNLKGVEKVKEMQKIAVEQSRLGIPLLVGMDVIHGYETIFPIPLALSCSWDVDAVEEAARIAAKEASADGVNWVFSPMVDICVDARWGRIAEGNGEDPYLGAQLARAMIRGYQGDYSSRENVMACMKHFALYGAVEAGLDYNTVDMSRLRMFNQYFPPYRAAVEEGAGSVMSSFNIVDGIPATANKWLLDDVLRKMWKFDGFVATDYGSIGEMTSHGVGGDLKHASALALNAGTDMDMCATGFISTLEQSVKDGTVSLEAVDAACRRVLEAKYKLGLFKDPYKYCDPKRRSTDIFTAENRAAARRIAAETFVLLKNRDNMLPLKKQGKIALIGPLADTRDNIAGTWCVAYTPEKYSTLKEGFERALKGKAELLYAQGCNLMADLARQRAAESGKAIRRGDDAQLKAEALKVAMQADVIVCAMGECADMSGESSSRSDLRLPDVQRELLAELVKTGKPVVMLNFSGRPTVLEWEQENVDAIINVWFGGSEAADAICDVLFGDVAPSGRLTTSFPRTTGQLPMYYNYLTSGRPLPDGTKEFHKFSANWLDCISGPLYPFGYGLSYTTFSYGKPTVTGSGRTFKASVTVTNTGKMDACEVVQLYVHDCVASISRPNKELKGFSRVNLKAGESKEVTFDITEKELSYYNAEGEEVFEPGEFTVMLGHDSSTLQTVTITAE